MAVAINWPSSLMVEGGALLVAEVEAPGQPDSRPEDNRLSQAVTVQL